MELQKIAKWIYATARKSKQKGVDIWEWMKALIIRLIRTIPLIAHMPDVTLVHLRNAIGEVLFLVILATIPIWLGSLGPVFFPEGTINNQSSVNLYIEQLKIHALNGNIIFYCSALLAPVLFMALQHHKEPGGSSVPFPSHMSHVISIIVILLISTFFFAMQMRSDKINQSAVVSFSLWLMAITGIILFISHAYKYLQLDPAGKFRSQANSFANGYSRHVEERE